MTDAATTSRWSRRFVLTGAAFLVVWQLAVVAGAGRRTGVVLGLLGFVFHTVFGKAYSLVPTYFERKLSAPGAMGLHLALAASGTLALAAGVEWSAGTASAAGAALWAGGVAVFLGTVLSTLRGNLLGRETGTGTHNQDREFVDRVANLGVPAALGFFALGSYELLAAETALRPAFDGYAPRAVHFLAVGTAALLVFAIGFRLLPRFLATTPPEWLVVVVIPAGVAGPLALGAGIPAGRTLQLGALLQSTAVVGYAATVAVLVARTDRDRVGIYGVLGGAAAGVLAVALGLVFAFDGTSAALVTAHLRVALLGFLGLTIVGVSYQFYPPAVASLPVDGNAVAAAAIALLGGALVLELLGTFAGGTLTTFGHLAALVGSALHVGLLGSVFAARSDRRWLPW